MKFNFICTFSYQENVRHWLKRPWALPVYLVLNLALRLAACVPEKCPWQQREQYRAYATGWTSTFTRLHNLSAAG